MNVSGSALVMVLLPSSFPANTWGRTNQTSSPSYSVVCSISPIFFALPKGR
jgi:hypothetical protein